MKRTIFFFICLLPSLVFAGSLMLPQSSIAPNPAYSRNGSLGTKGYKCWSTVNRDGFKCRTATETGTATVTKWFLNGDESVTYPTSEDTLTTERGKVISICQRAYSSATAVNSYCWGQ